MGSLRDKALQRPSGGSGAQQLFFPRNSSLSCGDAAMPKPSDDLLTRGNKKGPKSSISAPRSYGSPK